jgi:hypothetical protein
MRKLGLATLAAAALAFVGAGAAAATPVVASNANVDQDHGLLFPQNKQNEPAITRDPSTGVLVAGANDEINEPLCHTPTAPLTSPCPFGPSVSVNGYYRSTNGGKSWTGGILPDVPGRVGGGDPSLDYGPRRCASGSFSYACGTVIYYASLGDPFPEFAGEQILSYRSYDDGKTWSTPTLAASLDRKSNFADHEWIAVAHTPGAAYFGRAYLFWANYCNTCSGFGNVKLYVSHSDDEGQTWSPALQVSAANNNLAQGERETGQLAVSSDGTVEAFWTENADSKGKYPDTQVVVTSKDGGNTFTAPITVGYTTDYPLTGTPFDAVDLYNRVPGMSARVDCYPHPASDPRTGSGAVYVVWCDFTGGHGVVKGAVSTDGLNWRSLGTIGDVAGRNAFFPAASVSSVGLLAVSFDALTAPAGYPWETGKQVYDNYYVQSTNGGASFTSPLRVSTASSNPDASSYNNTQEQFIGDYIGIAAGPASAYMVWTDERAASACAAVDDYRNAVYAGSKTAVAANPDTDCATNFGNTDTEAGVVNY